MTHADLLPIDDFAEWGIRAFTTTKAVGSFGLHTSEPVADVHRRWQTVIAGAAAFGARQFATAHQVHGGDIVEHRATWEGWLRCAAADGHAWIAAGVSAAVTIADCVPVFLAHPSGAAAVLHSGWRGTVAGISERAVAWYRSRGLAPGALRAHLGPAICGDCYEVSPDVYAQVTGQIVSGPTLLDLRAAIAGRLQTVGVHAISVSEWCTRCHNDRLYSHRAGDAGRQIGVLMTPA
jgi:polyphenol oxidase